MTPKTFMVHFLRLESTALYLRGISAVTRGAILFIYTNIISISKMKIYGL